MAFVHLSNMPAPATERVSNIPSLSGGLNIHDAPWNLSENQSPEMKNMWWEDGVLRSRPAQVAPYSALEAGVAADITTGPCDAYPQLYKGWYVFRKTGHMYMVSEDLQIREVVDTSALTWQNPETDNFEPALEQAHYGTFFLFDGRLYYKARNIYAVIEADTARVVNADRGLYMLRAKPVEPFIPTLLLNADPDTPGAGDLYQPLNRLSDCYDILYTAEAGTRIFYTPLDAASADDVLSVSLLNEDGSWVRLTKNLEYEVLRSARANTVRVRFKPDYVDLIEEDGVNNVRIRIAQESTEYQQAKNAFDSCHLAAVYGGSEGLCAVFSGSDVQPNAYFWSANTDVAMDPGYIPYEHYNIVGSFDDPIVALGTQQNALVILQQRRTGKAVFGTAEIDGRTFITMDYSTINGNIGCDIPKSVQLIENNLVFANSRLGVLQIQDTSAAGENVLRRISDNVDGRPDSHGLLYDLQNSTIPPTSFDDGQRYWLAANGHAWLWDYRLCSYTREPKNLTWFYFDNLKDPACWFGSGSAWGRAYVNRKGKLYFFVDRYPEGQTLEEDKWWAKYGEDFERVLTLPMRNFGTYALRKDIAKMVFTLDGSAESKVDVEYVFDHGSRQEPMPLVCDGTIEGVLAFIRRPRCLNVQSFFCRLRTFGQMAFAGAQIHYIYRGKER